MDAANIEKAYVASNTALRLERAALAVTLTNNPAPGVLADYHAAKEAMAAALGQVVTLPVTSFPADEAYVLAHQAVKLSRAALALTLTNNPSPDVEAVYDLAVDVMLGFFGEGSSDAVALAKAAVASAPTLVSAVPSRAGPVGVLGGDNQPPPYNYQRYWISGDGINNGGGGTDNPRLPEVAFIYNFENWGLVFGGGVTNNMSDGSRAMFHYAGSNWSGSPPMIGIETNSRYLSFPTSGNGFMSLMVDGQVVRPTVQFSGSNRTCTWDFGTQALRKIVLIGGFDTWVAEVCVEDGATIAPYDFRVDFPVTISGTGDSYYGPYDLPNGISFAHMKARMIGALGLTATHAGNTGYYADGGNGDDGRAAYPVRLARFTEALPTIMSVEVGINDPWPSADTVTAMGMLINGARAANPEGILVVMGPWGPNESDATNPAGSYIARMNTLTTIMAEVAGPWVLLDNLRGSWSNSKGAVRPALRGPWQTGTGHLGAPTGVGNGDTWVNADGTHPSVPEGITGLATIWAAEARAAIAAL